MIRRRPSSRRLGFTLLEVLIAIALILALVSAMLGFLYDVLATRSQVLEKSAQQHAASLLLERVEADLLTCLVGMPGLDAGVDGDEHSLRLLTRGVLANHAPNGPDDHAGFSDLQRTEYRFDPTAHEISAVRGPAAGNTGGEMHPFGARIYKVRFRYYDGQAWLNAFDSMAENRLPVAVEIAVWFDPWPGEDWEEADEFMEAATDTSPQRLTFEMEDAFDEYEYAMRADRDWQDEPVPDRVRVVLIPDATLEDDA